MNITAYGKKFFAGIITFLHVQLFITLVSLPLLLAWGLPFSYLTFAGNFIFSPFLSIFLLLSSLIFFSELLHIPNGILMYALEKVHDCWYWLLQWASPATLMALPKPSLMVLILIPLAACTILHCKKIVKPWHGIACYAFLLLAVQLYLKTACTPVSFVEKMPCNGSEVLLIYADKKVTLVDNGVIGKRLSARNWLEHTLLPHLVQKCGSLDIEQIVVTYPNKTIFEALHFVLDKVRIKTISLAFWQGKIPPSAFAWYCKLKEKCIHKGCTFTRLNSFKPTKMALGTGSLIITPTPEMIQKTGFTYPRFAIEYNGIA